MENKDKKKLESLPKLEEAMFEITKNLNLKQLKLATKNLNNNSKKLKLTNRNISKHFNINRVNYQYGLTKKEAGEKVDNWLNQKHIKKWFDYKDPKQWEEIAKKFNEECIALYPMFSLYHK